MLIRAASWLRLGLCRSAISSRRSAVQRTKSTQKSSQVPCSNKVCWRRGTWRARTSSSSILALSSTRLVKNPSTRSSMRIEGVGAGHDRRDRMPRRAIPIRARRARSGSGRRSARSTDHSRNSAATRETIPRSSTVTNLLEMPRVPSGMPWAYVKVAEGCDRRCGFSAIPSFRGRQVSRDRRDREGDRVAWTARGDPRLTGPRKLRTRSRHAPRTHRSRSTSDGTRRRVRLLYLYPSALTAELVDTVLATGVPYFDLSLQHVSGPLLRRMRRYGNGIGSSSASRTSATEPPRPRSDRRSSSVIRGREKPTTTSYFHSSPQHSSTGEASLPSPTRPAPTPTTYVTRCRDR